MHLNSIALELNCSFANSEDAKEPEFSLRVCRNPCSDGICGGTARMQHLLSHTHVLILVLMEFVAARITAQAKADAQSLNPCSDGICGGYEKNRNALCPHGLNPCSDGICGGINK